MGTAGQSITLANSIIGVGILAMPFCFQQCGVLLATLILVTMGLISRLCCHFLLKSALLARRRNFEFLAFHVFGPAGKLAVELGIIGFLMGTCIAYFVVVGDLGPQIVAKMFNINQSDILRTSIMVIVSLVCVLPLGLLRNVDSLSNVSAATIGFYFCLVMKVIVEAASQLFADEWQSKMELWRPDGVLQCVPIFSMALFCQTQLFEIFESLPTLSLEKMNVVTKNAINICTAVYFTLGLFGYIAFCSQEISGNILMSLSPTMASDVIKLGFVMSLAFSFPLIIFPCRASLYSFLYKKIHSAHHDHIINHSIPETTFRCITVAIIAVALFISLLIPNIETVLGLVGATIGVLICVVFPAACFINLTFKDTNERLLAKGILILGLVILVLGTYANLQAAETKQDKYDGKITQERIDQIVEDFFQKNEAVKPLTKDRPKIDQIEPIKENIKKDDVVSKDSEVQPPNPVPPNSHSNEAKPLNNNIKIELPPERLMPVDNVVDKVSESHPKNLQIKLNESKLDKQENIADKPLSKPKEIVESDQENNKERNDIKNQEKIDIIKQRQLIETIKQHGKEQKELIKEQKEILDEIKKTKNELKLNKKELETVEAKKMAVESIQKIADNAIKSLSGVSESPKGEKEDKKAEPLEVIANEAVQEIAKKAVEAIEVIKEKKIEEEKNLIEKVNNLSNNTPIQNKPVPNPQVNVPDVKLEDNINKFAPVQPPPEVNNAINQKPVNAPEAIPHAEALIQKYRDAHSDNIIPVNPNPVLPAQGNQHDVVSNNEPVPLFNENRPINNNIVIAPKFGDTINKDIQGDQAQNLDIKVNRDNVQNGNINQDPSNIKQEIMKEEDRARKLNIIETLVHNKNIVELEPEHKDTVQKAHSHSPDEPKSYKLGEDLQTAEMAKNVAENIPVPIVMNGNSKPKEKQADVSNINKEPVNNDQMKNVQNSLNNAQLIGAENNNVIKNNLGDIPARQKREVVDCTKTNSLAPQDKEICKSLVNVKRKDNLEIQNINIKLEDKVELQSLKDIDIKTTEILPSKVDLNEGLNRLPIELIHHGRSLKSLHDEKRR